MLSLVSFFFWGFFCVSITAGGFVGFGVLSASEVFFSCSIVAGVFFGHGVFFGLFFMVMAHSDWSVPVIARQ